MLVLFKLQQHQRDNTNVVVRYDSIKALSVLFRTANNQTHHISPQEYLNLAEYNYWCVRMFSKIPAFILIRQFIL